MELNTTYRRQMADIHIMLILSVFLFNGIYTYEVDGVEKDLLDTLVKEKKLKEDGYTDFEVAEIHEININGLRERLSSESIRRRKRSLLSDDLTLNLTFNAFHETFKMAVKHNTQLVPPSLSVVFFEKGNPSIYKGSIPDCLLQGRTEDHGIVSLTYCEGITGSIMQGEYLYRLDPIGQMGEHFNETILVSKSLSKHRHREHDYTNELKNNIWLTIWMSRNLPYNIYKIVSKRNVTQQQNKPPPTRHKRQTYPPLTIELGVYVDEIFYQTLEDKGATTREQKIKYMVILWNMAQAMLNIPEELGYEIILQIKGIEFWQTNPAWFTFTKDDIYATKASFESGVKSTNPPDYDHFSIHTATEDSAQGLAGRPAVCVNSAWTSLSSDKNFFDGYISAHELGHALGMKHDPEYPCTEAPVDGFMAVSGYPRFGWSSCSKAALHEFATVTRKDDCLNFENVPAGSVPADIAGITINGLWPGMAYSPDEICELDFGPGYQFRPYFITVAECGVQSCVNANDGIYYGTIVSHFPKYGTYCGIGKVCNPRLKPKCLAFADTRIPVENIPVVFGGWSEWGPVGACSRTCGTGLMVKARTCTNPKPLNTGSCAGSYYQGEICNTQPCATDPTNVGMLIKLRAGETCQRLMNDGVIPAVEYDGTGAARGVTNAGRCEVKCNNAVGYTSSPTQRFAFIPDGTPCTHETVTLSDREILGYIRGRDYKLYCLRGYCEVFGCDNLSGVKATDLCGVCGGDTSTCTPVDKMYCEPVAFGERVTVVTIPAGATQLLFYFTHNKMRKWFVELWSTSDESVMVSKIDGFTNTGDTPINKAGTDWHFWNTKQYLWGIGPTTQDLVLKIFNSAGLGSNVCVHIGFSLPPTDIQKGVLLKRQYRKVEILTNNYVRNAVVVRDLHFWKSSESPFSHECFVKLAEIGETATIPTFVTGTQDDAQPDPAPEPSNPTLPTSQPPGSTDASGTTSGSGGSSTTSDGGSGTTSGSGGSGTTSGGGSGTTSGSGGSDTTSGDGSGTTSGSGGSGTNSGSGGTGTVAQDQCKAGRFYCSSNNMCFGYQELCNGKADCPDKSDEISVLCKSAAPNVNANYLVAMSVLILYACVRRL